MEMNNGVYITGTMIPAILGVSKWETPLELYLRIVSGEKIPDNESMEAGRMLEGYVGNVLLSEKLGRPVKILTGQSEAILYHKSIPYLKGRIDGRLDDGRIVEIKTTKQKVETLPIEYYLQLQFYLWLAGVDEGFVGVYQYEVPPSVLTKLYQKDPSIMRELGELEVWKVEADGDLQAMMEVETSKFYTALTRNEPPAPPENIDHVRRLYAQATLGAKPLALDTIKKIEQLKEVKRQIKELETKEAEITKAIMEVLKEHEAGIDDTGKVLVEWKNFTRAEFDTKRFKAEHPDLFEKYAIEKNFRTFRIK